MSRPHPRRRSGRGGAGAILALLPLQAAVLAAQNPSFTINFRSLESPLPRCGEENLPMESDSTGDCLYGTAGLTGQPIECLESASLPNADCPAVTIGVGPRQLLHTSLTGAAPVDFDTTDDMSCANNCLDSCKVGGVCAISCCTPLPGDFRDGLDFEYDPGVPSEEEITIFYGVSTLLRIVFWRAHLGELLLERGDCKVPLRIDFREGESDAGSADTSFTFPGGGFYLYQNLKLTLRNPAFLPGGTMNDRIALQEIGTELVQGQEQPGWRRGCPVFAVPFDRGLAEITTAEWVVTDDANRNEPWRSTIGASTNNCACRTSPGGPPKRSARARPSPASTPRSSRARST